MKKYIATISLILAVFVLFILWYDHKYSMEDAKPFVSNSSSLDAHVLIATQGSEYKDLLVQRIVSSDQLLASYIKVIDISDLGDINTDNWSAIIIIHTWEMWRPPLEVKNFVSRNLDAQNLIVFTTSGSGDTTLLDVDGITGASIIEEVSEKAAMILHKLEPLLP